MKTTKKWLLYIRLYLLLGLSVLSTVMALRLFDRPGVNPACLFNAGTDVLGIFVCIVMYYVALLCGKEPDSQIVKWAMDLLIVPFFGYITYQLGMKNSLNKHGLYIDGGKVKKIQ